METLVAALLAAFMALPVTKANDNEFTPSATSSSAEKPFTALDKNKDGSLSRDEVKGTWQEKHFAKLDSNSDGKLSRQEYGGESASSGATGGTSSGAAGSSTPRSSGSASK
jgi:Ca2+-binding EF-hand superfamily protein